MPEEKQTPLTAKLLQCMHYVRPYLRLEILLVLLILVAKGSQIAAQYLYRPLVDRVFVGGEYRLFLPLLGGYAALHFLAWTCYGLRNVYATKIEDGVLLAMRKAIVRKLYRASLSFHSRSQTGDLVSRLTSDIVSVRHVVSNLLVDGASSALELAARCAVLILLSWPLALLIMGLAPLSALLHRAFDRKLQAAERVQRETNGKLSGLLTQGLSGIRSVKAFGLGEFLVRRLAHLSAAIGEASVSAAKVDALLLVVANAGPLLISLGV